MPSEDELFKALKHFLTTMALTIFNISLVERWFT
jgi:hypothetical protein